MSETEAAINNHREEDDGNRRRKSEMVSRQVFPPLSSRKRPGSVRPYEPKKYDSKTLVQNNDINPSGLEDFVIGISRDFSALHVSDDTDDDESDDDESDVDRGPCWICHGPHSRLYCQGLDVCPIDLKVGEPYEVICLCGSLLNNGKCSDGCPRNLGRVIDKSEEFKYFW